MCRLARSISSISGFCDLCTKREVLLTGERVLPFSEQEHFRTTESSNVDDRYDQFLPLLIPPSLSDDTALAGL